MNLFADLYWQNKELNEALKSGSGGGKTTLLEHAITTTICNILKGTLCSNMLFCDQSGFLKNLTSCSNSMLNLSRPHINGLVFSLNDGCSIHKFLRKYESKGHNEQPKKVLNALLTKRADLDDQDPRAKKIDDYIKNGQLDAEKQLSLIQEAFNEKTIFHPALNFDAFVELIQSASVKSFLAEIAKKNNFDCAVNKLVPAKPCTTFERLLSQQLDYGDVIFTSLTYEDWLKYVNRGDYIGTTRQGTLASSLAFKHITDYRIEERLAETKIKYSYWACGFESFGNKILPQFIFRTMPIIISDEFAGLNDSETRGYSHAINNNDHWVKIDLCFKFNFSHFKGDNTISKFVTEGIGQPTTSGAVVNNRLDDDMGSPEVQNELRMLWSDQKWIDHCKNGFIRRGLEEQTYGVITEPEVIYDAIISNVKKAAIDIFMDGISYNFIALKRNNSLMLTHCRYKKVTDLPEQLRKYYDDFDRRDDLYHLAFSILYKKGQVFCTGICNLFKHYDLSRDCYTILQDGNLITVPFDMMANFCEWTGTNFLETIGDISYYISTVDTIVQRGLSSGLIRILASLTYSPNWTEFILRDTNPSEQKAPAWIFGLTSGIVYLLQVKGKWQPYVLYSHRLTDRVVYHLLMDSTVFTSHFTKERAVMVTAKLQRELHRVVLNYHKENYLKRASYYNNTYKVESYDDFVKVITTIEKFEDEPEAVLVHPDTLMLYNQKTHKNLSFGAETGFFNLREIMDQHYAKQLYEKRSDVNIVATITNVAVNSQSIICFKKVTKKDTTNPNSWIYEFLGSVPLSKLIVNERLDEATELVNMDVTHLTPLYIERWRFGSLIKTIEFLCAEKDIRRKLTDVEELINIPVDDSLKNEFAFFLQNRKE